MMVQPFVENAILHGLIPKAEKGYLYISYANDGEKIKCIIQDNGIGREAAQKRKRKRRTYYESIGIGLVSEQLTLLAPKAKKRMTIEDLHNESGQPSGTRVCLWIPKMIL